MAAIIQAGQILLIKREDFEVWALPAGQMEAGETVAQAAIREVHEETGLEVQLTRLVGIYSIPGWVNGGGHAVLFAARPIGGSLNPAQNEVIEIGYFSPHKLPEPLIWWHRQRILDAMNDVDRSVARSQHVHWPFEPDLSRKALYELRDRSGLSRQGFFLKYFDQSLSGDELLELGPAQAR
jgi:ADP-ribose pyrophosphatase YjhB (NUDIX family)